MYLNMSKKLEHPVEVITISSWWKKKTLLAELVKERVAGAMVHLRMSRIQLETPNKEFFNLEKAVKTSRQIHSLHSSDGVLTCQSDIKHSMQDFYSNLFTPRTVDKTMIN